MGFSPTVLSQDLGYLVSRLGWLGWSIASLSPQIWQILGNSPSAAPPIRQVWGISWFFSIAFFRFGLNEGPLFKLGLLGFPWVSYPWVPGSFEKISWNLQGFEPKSLRYGVSDRRQIPGPVG